MRTSHVAASRFRGGRTTLGIAEGAGLDRFDDADAVHRHFAYDTALGPDSSATLTPIVGTSSTQLAVLCFACAAHASNAVERADMR
jgi:hypothetical protein